MPIGGHATFATMLLGIARDCHQVCTVSQIASNDPYVDLLPLPFIWC